MTPRIIGWWRGLTIFGKLVVTVGIVAAVVVAVVVLRGPTPPLEVPYT